MADDTTRIINLTEATEVSDGMYLVTDSSTGTRKLSLQKVLDKAGGNVADDYDATATYDVGDFCIYNNLLYECITEITTAEAWNSAHWTQANVSKEISGLKEDLDDLQEEVGDGRLYENGAVSTSDYYKAFSILKQGVTYKLKVTAHTSGSYTLASSTVATSSGIVDTIGSANFVANTPVYFVYTPTANVYFLRLLACTNWDVSVYDVEPVWDAIENLETQADSSTDAIEKGFEIVQNNNRLDYSAVIAGKRYNENGALVNSSDYVTTAPIPLEEGETVYFSFEEDGVRHYSTMWYLIFFSSNGSTVLDYINESGTQSYTAGSDGLLRFSFKPEPESRSNFFCGTISDPNYYDQYGYSYIAKQAKTYKPYSGIIWACVGDSMTATGTSAKKHYFDYIADELGFIAHNYGVSGTGYAAQAENNKAFYQRISNITEPFDVLTILGSVNDLSVDLPLGTYEDSGTTTIAGYINAAIDAFYVLAPFKKIGIISQPPSVGTANNGHLIGTDAQAFSDLLGQICKNRGIPFLDLFNCSGLRPWDSDYREEYYNEDGVQDTGVHPNSKGQKQMSTKIREFLKTVI